MRLGYGENVLADVLGPWATSILVLSIGLLTHRLVVYARQHVHARPDETVGHATRTTEEIDRNSSGHTVSTPPRRRMIVTIYGAIAVVACRVKASGSFCAVDSASSIVAVAFL